MYYIMSSIRLTTPIDLNVDIQEVKLRKDAQDPITITFRKYLTAVCNHCNDEDVVIYRCNMNDQKINGIPVSMAFTLTLSKYESNQIHYLTITDISLNVAEITYIDYYQTIPLLNFFMKKYYDKDQYIDQENCHKGDYDIQIQKNNTLTLCEYNNITFVKINNKRLFKNLIVIMKCIVDHLHSKIRESYINYDLLKN